MEQIGGLENNIASGDSTGLLEWLRVNIHSKGRYYTSEELCKEVTGKTLDVTYFIDYLLHKYSRIYTL
jgi:carboxypeptidase Taq